MRKFEVDALKMKSWKSFHAEFKVKLDFPDYYGNNMNAWVDCLDELLVQPTVVHIKNAKILKEKSPEFLSAILECGAFVNYRKIEVGERPMLIITANI